jgi:hypothetical protein
MVSKTGIGIGNGIPFGNMASGRGKPYLSPEVKEALKAVVIAYGKTNNDSDMAVVKNLVDPDNPFVISNAAYTEGSGYADKGSPYYGAFVTDGVNDLINSTKTVQEMLGGSNEITVVSMMANLDSRQILCNSNYNNTNGYNVRNTLEPNGVISMLGYTDKNGTTNNLNLIMGDKDSIKLVDKVNFNSDYVFYPAQYYGSYYQVAWYWTIIANKVLTTDEINQVIAYFNLDRTLNPDILCDIEKQGITNENHAEFDDKLIDFSGNGRDIQLNNIAWKGDSGIGKYEVDFLDSSIWVSSNSAITSSKIDCKNAITHIMLLYYNVGGKEYPDIPSFKIIKTGADIDYSYIDETGFPRSVRIVDGVNVLPASHNTLYSGSGRFCGFGNPGIGNSVTITQIPSHAGALCLDGINDFGKVTGMPIYKDYTVIADREIETINGGVLSKSYVADNGSFIFEQYHLEQDSTSSFGYTKLPIDNLNRDRKISYQSKYSYNGTSLSVGRGIDGSNMWLATIRDNDSRFSNIAIYSLMTFPYSMSEFLIKRQLKKHKLGTLYPDMVEFRPVIKTNVDYTLIQFYINNYTKRIYPGDYIPINTPIQVNFYLKNNVDELISFKVNGNDSIFKRSTVVDNAYNIETLPITKSPQKINITIDEYIRYEDIVQPYPSFVKLENLDRTYTYTWGDKLKVGDTIRYNSSKNLLEGAYTLRGALECNGVYVFDNNQQIVVTKEMVFAWTHSPIWNIDDNEPKVILSPSRLRIPNSSYKILGYIPDISGHGNNGVIYNSAYAEGSGVNEDGSYQFNGVDDFVTIPTIVGGKQVLMKTNWQNRTGLLYDQRKNGSSIDAFAILNVNSNNSIAYNSRNTDGETYIDGILNKNIVCPQLYKITHSITIINQLANKEEVISPTIGSDTTHKIYFSQMSLYDFMLFDDISTEDKIKELNEYVGIEGNTE